MTSPFLAGVRVAEFSLHGTGPYCCELLGFLGAEVIRAENRYDVRDILRLRQPWGFNETNFDKMGISIDLRRPEGTDLARRLVEISDVVVENFRPGVIARLGLGYDALVKIRPNLIMLSCSGMGQVGPESQYVTVAGSFASLSGLCDITGYPDGIPTEQRSIFDYIVGQSMALAVVAALLYRRRTGKGQYIDLAAREVVSGLIGDVLMEYTMNGRNPSRKGNRDDFMAPHGCYRCRGDDKWVSIAVADDREWRSLCQAMGKTEVATDPRFCDSFSRLANQDQLDNLISEWTAGQTNHEVTDLLQDVGIAAFPCVTSEDVLNDPHLRERGFVQVVEHSELGRRLALGQPWSFSGVQKGIDRMAPGLGQHNDYVFKQLLGLSCEEVRRLEMVKVI